MGSEETKKKTLSPPPPHPPPSRTLTALVSFWLSVYSAPASGEVRLALGMYVLLSHVSTTCGIGVGVGRGWGVEE